MNYSAEIGEHIRYDDGARYVPAVVIGKRWRAAPAQALRGTPGQYWYKLSIRGRDPVWTTKRYIASGE